MMTERREERTPPHIVALDPEVAARIAAGEVIERPASVVKELLENALDAGCSYVRIELEAGGIERVRIVDNGYGIAADELELAFRRHATSKLRSIDDLEAIVTLGFRGEALPSIAAVSTVFIRTRVKSEAAGSSLLLRQGEIVERQSLGLPGGTSIEVSDLFANLPARRKFLKGRQAEFTAAQQVITQYALANPGLAVTLLADGQTVFTTSGSASLTEVLACLYGVELVQRLEHIDAERHGVRVRGLVSSIGHTKATRSQQSFFVNGRWVRNRILNVALEEGYHSMLLRGRHPVGVVFLDIPPAELDVNVHPTKSEIRFLREREVFSAIRHAVSLAIRQNQPVDSAVGASPPETDAMVQQQLIDLVTSPAIGPDCLPAPLRAMPALRVLGQAGSLFIIAEGPDGVYMVDQHAAHERIIYDDLSTQLAGNTVPVQALLEPSLVEVSAAAMDALQSYGDVVRAIGFDAEPFGDATCVLRAVPAVLSGASPSDTLQALLEDLAGGKERSEMQDRLLATMACKAAVKAGQTLTLDEMRFLVQRLEATSRPRTCPHGRPTMILLTTSALERQFGRR